MLHRSGFWTVYSSGACIVTYHGVVEIIQEPWLETEFISLSTFVEHLDYFQKRRVVVSLNELLSCLSDGKTPDPRFVVLCFDDALACLAPHVVSELAARRMPFVIGVPAGLPGSGRSLWEYEAAFLVYLLNEKGALADLTPPMREIAQKSASMEWGMAAHIEEIERLVIDDAPRALATLKRLLRLGISSARRRPALESLLFELEPSFKEMLETDGRFSIMSWEQLLALQSIRGTVAAHGFFHHPHNATLADSCRRIELERSIESINRHTGVTTDCFIWPEGISDPASIEVGKEVGYKYFLSTRTGRLHRNTSPTDIPRVSGQWPLSQVLWNAASLR